MVGGMGGQAGGQGRRAGARAASGQAGGDGRAGGQAAHHNTWLCQLTPMLPCSTLRCSSECAVPCSCSRAALPCRHCLLAGPRLPACATGLTSRPAPAPCGASMCMTLAQGLAPAEPLPAAALSASAGPDRSCMRWPPWRRPQAVWASRCAARPCWAPSRGKEGGAGVQCLGAALRRPEGCPRTPASNCLITAVCPVGMCLPAYPLHLHRCTAVPQAGTAEKNSGPSFPSLHICSCSGLLFAAYRRPQALAPTSGRWLSGAPQAS